MYKVEFNKNHVIINILGIKFKFKLNESVYTIKDITNTSDIELEHKLFNHFKNIEGHKFIPAITDRIDSEMFDSYISNLKNRFKKNVLILSDSKFIPSQYNKKTITEDDIENYSKEDNIFVLAYTKDYLAKKTVQTLVQKRLKYYTISQAFPLARYFHIDENAYITLQEEAQKNTNWHYCPVDFENIFQVLNACKNLDGDFVEIGTYKGDSASAVLNYMEKIHFNKKAYFIDTFVGFDYKEAYKSNDAQWQGSHTDTSLEFVKNRLEHYQNAIVLKSNIITDELPEVIDKICVANIDVDMYEAVKGALYKVKDLIVTNGIIICEDYGHTPALIGAQKAVDEFLEENPDNFIPIYMASGQMFLIKK